MPMCRTWIHCCPKAKGRDQILALDTPPSSAHALRIGFADAYICELRGYVGIEAYLAFLRHDLREVTLFEWLLEPEFGSALDHTVRFWQQRFDVPSTLSCEQLAYLQNVAREAGKTGELWSWIEAAMNGRGEEMNQRPIDLLVDDWILGGIAGSYGRTSPILH